MPFHNLCMRPQTCDCKNPNGNIECTRLGRLNGVYHCSDCRKNCKEDIIKYINTNGEIPLYGGLGDGKYSIELNFFRKSKDKIYDGTLNKYEKRYLFGIRRNEENKYFVRLIFDDDKFSKYVSLGNIFYHNPCFYEKLISCKNLFADKNIIISFDDLSKEIKDTIKKIFEDTKGKKSSDFIH